MTLVNIVDYDPAMNPEEIRRRKDIYEKVSAIEAMLNQILVKDMSYLMQSEAGWLISIDESLEEWTGCLMDSIASQKESN